MWAALAAIATALAAWLRLKALTATYDLQRRIDDDIAQDEARIAALRARGDDAAQLAADRLRERIVRARGIVGDLPTPSAAPGEGPARADGSGSVHPAGG